MRIQRSLLACMILSTSLAACGSHEPAASPVPTSAPSETSAQAAAPRAVAPVDNPEPPAVLRPAIADADAHAVLDAWLAAQNEGDFAAYSALYATRFSGVKRSDDRVRSFTHDGWLANRQRMFRRPQQVAARDVSLQTTADMVDMRFVQAWSSATYSDEGPKRLLLAREGQSLRIAREEMLASTRTDAAAAPAAELPVALRFMLQALPGRVELAPASADEAQAWSSGRPRLLASEAGTVVVTKRVRRGALPPALRSLVGSSYRVYGDHGEVCEGAITGLSLVRRYTPHFGQLDGWNADHLSSVRRAVEAWETGVDGGVLVGELESAAACGGGLFAMPSGAPAVTFSPRRELTAGDALHRGMEATARAGQEYASIQRDFAAEGGQGLWSASEGASARFLRFGDSVATLEWEAGEGCGGFYGTMLLPFAVHGDEVEARPLIPPMFGARPVAVFDWKADGEPALLVRDATGDLFLLSPDGSAYHVSVQRDVPYFDCPC